MILRKRKMIKWIKSIIEKVFGKKEEPIVSEDEVKQEEVKEVIIAEPEKIQCNTHSRFKKSCPICVEAAK
jgi:hypothetical protein